MVTHKHVHHEPAKCEKCGAMYFSGAHLHAYVCCLYQVSESMVRLSHEYYTLYLIEKANEAAKPKEKKPRKRKKREEDNGVQVERSAGGKDRHARKLRYPSGDGR